MGEQRPASGQAWKGFNAQLACDYYVEHGAIDEKGFWNLFDDMFQIRMLELPDLDWVLFDHALSVFRRVPLLTHYRAIAAGMSMPFEGISEFCEAAVRAGDMPPWTLHQTSFPRFPEGELRIGELMVAVGALDQAAVDRSLEIKKIIKSETGIDAAVGQIFRSVSRLSLPDFFQVLGHQVGIPFESMNASAPAIFEAAMKR